MVCKSSKGFKFKITIRNMNIFQECLNTILIKAKRQEYMPKIQTHTHRLQVHLKTPSLQL